VSEKVVVEIKTRFMFNNFFFCFFPKNPAVYEIMWKNIVERGRPQMTIWRMRIPCWITKATNTQLAYVILIAFPPQQRLHERASMLRYTYIACPVSVNKLHLKYGRCLCQIYQT